MCVVLDEKYWRNRWAYAQARIHDLEYEHTTESSIGRHTIPLGECEDEWCREAWKIINEDSEEQCYESVGG